jgi:hypothetical protein
VIDTDTVPVASPVRKASSVETPTDSPSDVPSDLPPGMPSDAPSSLAPAWIKSNGVKSGKEVEWMLYLLLQIH